jgi:hypothetical protein
LCERYIQTFGAGALSSSAQVLRKVNCSQEGFLAAPMIVARIATLRVSRLRLLQ